MFQDAYPDFCVATAAKSRNSHYESETPKTHKP